MILSKIFTFTVTETIKFDIWHIKKNTSLIQQWPYPAMTIYDRDMWRNDFKGDQLN